MPRKNKEKKRENMFELHVHRPLPLFLDDAWWTWTAKIANVPVTKMPKQFVKCEPNHRDPPPKEPSSSHGVNLIPTALLGNSTENEKL